MQTITGHSWKKIMLAIAATAAALSLVFGLAGCSSTDDSSDEASNPETITIECYDGNAELISLEVPYDPERIAVMDLAALDILDNLGLGDRVVGCSTSTGVSYLASYSEDENVTNLGTIREADLEAVMECEPDVIFIGGRLSESYDELSEIAPVIYLSVDSDKGVVQSVNDNATSIASMFGLEDQVADLMAEFDSRISALSEISEGHTALVSLYTSGSVNVLGNDGRCSLIGNEVGFTNLASDEVTSTHGNEVSFETIVEMDPEYIFVLNRDAAIGSDGADAAQEVVENELVMGTTAYQNGNIIYMSNPAIWYTAEGGITALDVMLQDLEEALM